MTTIRTIVLTSACALGLVACDSFDRDVEQPEPVPEHVQEAQAEHPRAAAATNRAVESIVRARCEREIRCGNVGADRTYVSDDECETAVRNEWRDELNAYDCEEGVQSNELTECLQEVRNEDCSSPFETLERAVACRASDICNAV